LDVEDDTVNDLGVSSSLPDLFASGSHASTTFSWLSFLRLRLYALTSNFTIRHWTLTHGTVSGSASNMPASAPASSGGTESKLPSKAAAVDLGGTLTPAGSGADWKFSLVGSVGGHRWVHSPHNTVLGMSAHRSLPFTATVGADGRVVVWRLHDSNLISGAFRGAQYECHLVEEYPYTAVAWAPHHNDNTLTLFCGGPGVIDLWSLNSLTTQPRGAKAGSIQRLHHMVLVDPHAPHQVPRHSRQGSRAGLEFGRERLVTVGGGHGMAPFLPHAVSFHRPSIIMAAVGHDGSTTTSTGAPAVHAPDAVAYGAATLVHRLFTTQWHTCTKHASRVCVFFLCVVVLG
jgi:hypothetical protein